MKRNARRMSRWLRWVLALGLAVYLAACGFMAVRQRSFIYSPHAYSSAQVDQMAQSAKLERWTNSAGQFIGFKRPSPRQPADGTVLLAYGNKGTIKGVAHYADDVQNVAAFDFYILEYPGYEDRPGQPSQRSLFNAADEALQLLPANRPVYLIGESLGSGIASYLAGTYPDKIAGVLLLSPFNRLADLAQSRYPLLPVRLLLVDQFPSEDYLRNYHGRVGVMVCGRDTVVPAKFGLRLYDGYTGPKRLWEFPNAGHIEIAAPPAKFWKEVVEFWQTNQISSATQ